MFKWRTVCRHINQTMHCSKWPKQEKNQYTFKSNFFLHQLIATTVSSTTLLCRSVCHVSLDVWIFSSVPQGQRSCQRSALIPQIMSLSAHWLHIHYPLALTLGPQLDMHDQTVNTPVSWMYSKFCTGGNWKEVRRNWVFNLTVVILRCEKKKS